MTDKAVTFDYRVDRFDRLVWVSDRWLAFARENGATSLLETSPVGKPLWRFIEGRELCSLYEAIHARIRQTGKPVLLPFRCDSPRLQRDMQLKIEATDDGELLYQSRLLRAITRNDLPLLDSDAERSGSFLTVCSLCKRTLLEPIGWEELPEVAIRLNLFESSQVPDLRHSICPTCKARLGAAANNGSAA